MFLQPTNPLHSKCYRSLDETRILMLQFSTCNSPGAVYTVFLNCVEPLILVMWMIYIFLDVSINLSCLRIIFLRSLMPITALWIPETYSVPHSQPKGNI